MLHAQRRGKLTREVENLEDLLTSNVFGVFSYLEPEVGLLPFLVLRTSAFRGRRCRRCWRRSRGGGFVAQEIVPVFRSHKMR